MTLQDALGEARRSLNDGLKDWNPPKRCLLPVDPALAASCLRYSLRTGHRTMANAASLTLGLFAPDRLWSEMFKFAATETAVFDLTPTLALMAAKREKAWLRRKGGTNAVTSYLIDQLLAAPRSMQATHLWRLSFESPAFVAPRFEKVCTDARSVRRGMLELLGYEQSEIEGAKQVMNRLTETPEDALAVEVAIAAFRQTLAPAALMVPLIRIHLGKAIGQTRHGQSGYSFVNSKAQSGAQFSLVATLTKDTPAGRKAIREIMSALPDIGRTLDALGVDNESAIEIISELLERIDEGADCREVGWYGDLQNISRWAGVGQIGLQDAQALGSTLDANGLLVAEIRSAHIPFSLLNFA